MTKLQLLDTQALTEDTISVPVQIASDTPVAALEFTIRHDPAVLKFHSVDVARSGGSFTASVRDYEGSEDGIVGILLDSGAALDASTPVTIALVNFVVTESRIAATRIEFEGPNDPQLNSTSDIAGRLLPTEYAGGEVRTQAGEPTPVAAPMESLLQFFVYEHLPEFLQEISKPFGELAQQIVDTLPRNPERTVALRKLLEAKDCAVRAQLSK